MAREQVSDDAGMAASCRRGVLIGDRELRRPQTSGPEKPHLVQAVIKMPLVFALHKRGVPASRIVSVTGLAPSLVRAWIKRYGKFSDIIAACCIVNFPPDQEDEDPDD
jgi:hypothetical protein